MNAASASKGSQPCRAVLEKPLVVIVDDDPRVREGIGELFMSVDIDTIAFASTVEVLEALLPDRPGCLLLDVRMPVLSGLELQQRLLQRGMNKPVVFLTAHGDIPMTVQAMKAGAVDFLTKPARDQTLLDAVTAAIQRDIAHREIDRIANLHAENFTCLTHRERQTFRLVSRGSVNKQIAHDLGISEITVKLHRGNVMRKMKASSIGELIRMWELLPASLREHCD